MHCDVQNTCLIGYAALIFRAQQGPQYTHPKAPSTSLTCNTADAYVPHKAPLSSTPAHLASLAPSTKKSPKKGAPTGIQMRPPKVGTKVGTKTQCFSDQSWAQTWVVTKLGWAQTWVGPKLGLGPNFVWDQSRDQSCRDQSGTKVGPKLENVLFSLIFCVIGARDARHLVHQFSHKTMPKLLPRTPHASNIAPFTNR